MTITIVILGGAVGLLSAQQQPVGSPQMDLWDRDALPEGAIARYGATDRNPDAVGAMGLRYSNNGKLLAIKDHRQQIRILDFEDRELLGVLPTGSHRDFVFTPDDLMIAVGDRKSIRFWDITSKKEVRQIDQTGYCLASNSGRQQLFASGRGEVLRYSWPLLSAPERFKTKLDRGTIVPVALSHDGKLAFFHNLRQSELLDTETGEPVPNTALKGCQKAVFSGDSKQIATFNPGLTQLGYFDLRNAQKYRYTILDGQRISTAAFSLDGRFLYSGNFANQIIVWDLLTRTEIARVEGHAAAVTAIAASPTGLLRLVSGASAIRDRSVIFWDLKSRLFPEEKLVGELNWPQLWKDLGSDHAETSLGATRRLSQALREDSAHHETLVSMMQLVKSDGNVDHLVSQLDAATYAAREKATAQLRLMLREIRPQLQRHMQDASQEAKWRIRKILKAVTTKPGSLTVAGRRAARIVFALELLGNREAVATLRLISQFSDQAVAVEEALAAEARLSD